MHCSEWKRKCPSISLLFSQNITASRDDAGIQLHELHNLLLISLPTSMKNGSTRKLNKKGQHGLGWQEVRNLIMLRERALLTQIRATSHANGKPCRWTKHIALQSSIAIRLLSETSLCLFRPGALTKP